MNSKYLAWVDLESTGLDIKTCVILEVAIVITTPDPSLEVVDELTVQVAQSAYQLEKMNEWCMTQHIKSGLVGKDKGFFKGMLRVEGGVYKDIAEDSLCDFMSKYLCPRKIKSHMCGSSVHFDRAFLKEYMPKLESMFHYRNFDVSTIKKFMDLGGYPAPPAIAGKHRAKSDILDSIEYCRQHFRELNYG